MSAVSRPTMHMKAASFAKGASLRAAARPAAPALRKVAVTASLGKQVRARRGSRDSTHTPHAHAVPITG
jgi:hypothetical protein